MRSADLIGFLGVIERLKCNVRHSWTSDGTPETVAAHSWRLAVLALLLRDEFPEADMGRVVEMCLVHDWGEALTGDIPAFWKSETDEDVERGAVERLLSALPEGRRGEYAGIFRELDELKTPEARIFKALDKLEAVISHNEASLDTWLPLERELNLTYGEAECAEFPVLRELREEARRMSIKKLEEADASPSSNPAG